MRSLVHITIAEILHGLLGVLLLGLVSVALLSAAAFVVFSVRAAHALLVGSRNRRRLQKTAAAMPVTVQPGHLLPDTSR